MTNRQTTRHSLGTMVVAGVLLLCGFAMGARWVELGDPASAFCATTTVDR